MNKNEDLISIIMPAYNSEKYIGASIKSAIEQTYHNWELLVIDDCSTDNTAQIIENYAGMDRRVKYLKNKINVGVSESRNKGIKNALGSWIAFLDSDDIWEPEKLRKQILLANKKNAEFIFSGASYINEEGEAYKGIFEIPTMVAYEKLKKHNVISCSSVLIKKRFFESIKMENDNIHEDYAVWLKVLQLGTVAFGVNEPLLIYRLSRKSKSGNKIKTIKMTYQVFRFVGINRFNSFYYTVSHVLSSLTKYRRVFSDASL